MISRAEFIEYVALIKKRAYADGCRPDKIELHVDEAIFGFDMIAPHVEPDMVVLEIGSGVTVLSSFFSQQGIEVHAVEPVGPGFGAKADILTTVLNSSERNSNLHFYNSTIQNFDCVRKFDLIFSVNVFEHLENFAVALGVAKQMLAPGGQCRLAFPNYHIPYEAHYNLPIIFNKTMTEWIFRKHIQRYDEKHASKGLWQSLNFINASSFLQAVRQEELAANFDKTVMMRMFDRAINDEEFKKRRRGLLPILRLIVALRLHKLFLYLPIRLQPYLIANLVHEA